MLKSSRKSSFHEFTHILIQFHCEGDNVYFLLENIFYDIPLQIP